MLVVVFTLSIAVVSIRLEDDEFVVCRGFSFPDVERLSFGVLSLPPPSPSPSPPQDGSVGSLDQ